MALRDSSGITRFEHDGTQPTDEQRQALDQLFSVAYEELRRLASSVKRGDPSNTLSPTALVNEAWLIAKENAEASLRVRAFIDLHL